MATTERYLTVGEAAELLYVSPKTIARWAQEGKLPYMRTLGGHRRLPERAILDLVDRLKVAPTVDGGGR